MMFVRIWTVLLVAVCASPAAAQDDRPRVLLIGDSISIGYTKPVQERLKDEAAVSRNRGNAAHTGVGLARLDEWLGDTRWDVIHFNWGLHDLAYRLPGKPGSRDKVNGSIATPLDQYERNLNELVDRLQRTGAQLVWASTTPVPPGESGRVAGDEIRYNRVAERIMRERGIAIDDLHALVADRMDELGSAPGNVHFTKQGSAILADQVASSIRLALKRRAQRGLPNIVVILVDDMGWTDVGCFGSTYYETPNIDRLAAEGMRFTQAYAACAVCSPTRASLLTGRYPARIGITDWIHATGPEAAEALRAGHNIEGFDRPRNRPMLTPRNKVWLEDDEITIAEMLGALGYATCHVGKWHLGTKGHWPEDQGFDENHGGFKQGQPPSYFDPYANKNFPDGIPTLPAREKGAYLTDREADEAVSFIERNRGRPFFLYMAHYAVHAPIQAKAEMIEKYREKPKTNQTNPTYAAMVESVDDAVGRIVSALDAAGVRDNTLIIFTSDNGGATHFDATDNAPLRKGKGFPYEGGIREPFIVTWPGNVKTNAQTDVLVSSIDIMPTIAAAVGASLPADRVIDGRSLMPLFDGSGELDRDTLMWHFPHYWWGTRLKPYSIIRKGRWKLIHNYESDTNELYDIEADISETHDLANDKPELAATLKAELFTRLKEQGARMPKRNPDYKPK
jgi:arylsulfatase A-like enzyme/lysophospholipase L1-like esterase